MLIRVGYIFTFQKEFVNDLRSWKCVMEKKGECTAKLKVTILDFITSSLVTTESSIMLFAYLPFSQLPVAGFQMQLFLHIFFLDFRTHIDIYCYSKFDFNYIFYHQTYIYICMALFY